MRCHRILCGAAVHDRYICEPLRVGQVPTCSHQPREQQHRCAPIWTGSAHRTIVSRTYGEVTHGLAGQTTRSTVVPTTGLDVCRDPGARAQQLGRELAVLAEQLDEDLVMERRHGITSSELGDQVGGGIDVAERGGLEQAAGVDVVLAEQVCDGAGDLDQTIDAARGEGAAPLDEVGEGALAEAVEPARRAQDGAGHLGVAAQPPGAEPGELAIAGGGDAGADRRRGLAGLGVA